MSFPTGQAPASGVAPNDLELITRIRVNNDSAAVTELVHRHTGAYMSVIQQYEGYSDFRARANVPDLREDKFINIYQWALKYDPTRVTESGQPKEFKNYVWDMTKYMCKSLISRGVGCGSRLDGTELNEAISPSNDTPVMDTVEKDSAFDTVREEVAAIKDPLFRRIFKLRHGGNRSLSWRAIAKKTGLSHEGARKAYSKQMDSIKSHIHQ